MRMQSMNIAILASLLLVSFQPRPALACKMEPIGGSIAMIEAVTRELAKFSGEALEILSIEIRGEKVRAQVLFEQRLERPILNCKAFEYRLAFTPECSTKIVSRQEYLGCFERE